MIWRFPDLETLMLGKNTFCKFTRKVNDLNEEIAQKVWTVNRQIPKISREKLELGMAVVELICGFAIMLFDLELPSQSFLQMSSWWKKAFLLLKKIIEILYPCYRKTSYLYFPIVISSFLCVFVILFYN